MVIRAFCPECGYFTFAHDPRKKIYRCYSVKCRFEDKDGKYGKGLSEDPFTKLDASGEGLEKITDPLSSERILKLNSLICEYISLPSTRTSKTPSPTSILKLP